jgi:uncharacterized protein YoxC
MKRVLKVVGVVVVAGLLAQSMIMTAYLKKLDSALNQNLDTANQLLQAQRDIKNKNAVLNDMADSTQVLSQRLDVALAKTQTISSLITQLLAINAKTKQVQDQLVVLLKNNANTMQTINQSIGGLKSNTSQLAAQIEQLQAIVRMDSASLQSVAASAAEMNKKLP